MDPHPPQDRPPAPSREAGPPRYSLILAKEDFKFSAAHFTLFPGGRAELLHGHNYRVRVEVAGPRLDDTGLLVDISGIKARIRACCRRFDERTLIPAEAGRLEIIQGEGEDGDGVEVRFDGRRYRFPEADVVLLPLANVSIELLAHHLWQELAPPLAGGPVDELVVGVEETAGQRCTYRAPLRP